jgi:serine protease Do
MSVFSRRLAGLPWIAAAAAAMGMALAVPTASRAQLIEISAPSPEVRERLYQELDAEVAELERRGNLLKRVVRLVRPTVVHIEARKADAAKTSTRAKSIDEAGSGVIIEIGDKRYVLTNRHVIKDAPPENITIGLDDGRELRPTQVWEDSATDVAVMELPPTTGLIAARIGDSSVVEIGDFALAVGSPFGLSHSVTYGIISAKGRRNLELGERTLRYQDFLQTDAAINPGNSGGPLMNLRGQVIGVNTAIASNSGGNEGIGFSIPINMAIVVARQLVEQGSVARAFLGVRMDANFGPAAAARLGLPRPVGARVSAVTSGSPAEVAGVRAGDIILRFGDIEVEDDTHLVNLVSLTPIGEQVEIVVLRDGAAVKLPVSVSLRSE